MEETALWEQRLSEAVDDKTRSEREAKVRTKPCLLWMCFYVPCQVFALAAPTVTRDITSRILPVVADCSGALQAADIAARHESALEAVADSAAAVEEGEGDRALKYALAAVRALVGDDGAPVRDTPGLDDDSSRHNAVIHELINRIRRDERGTALTRRVVLCAGGRGARRSDGAASRRSAAVQLRGQGQGEEGAAGGDRGARPARCAAGGEGRGADPVHNQRSESPGFRLSSASTAS